MKDEASFSVALIGDVIASRKHASRKDLQRDLEGTLNSVNENFEAVQRLEATIGDEFQAVYASIPAAVTATLLVRLELPEAIDVRFGLGGGSLQIVGKSAYGLTQDGSAWWAAREAVDEVENRQRRTPGLRTWLGVASDLDATQLGVNAMNSYLLCRDQLVSQFDGRGRRIAARTLAGDTLASIARDERVSASAISQRYRGGINAVIESARAVLT